MSAEELELGYDWIYRRLFSCASIWRRRPGQASAVPAYLAMSVLYKKSNRLWHFLIRHGLVRRVWAPLVEMSRRRHLHWRRELERQPWPADDVPMPAASIKEASSNPPRVRAWGRRPPSDGQSRANRRDAIGSAAD